MDTSRMLANEREVCLEYKILRSVVLLWSTRELVPIDSAFHLISEITRFSKVSSW